MRVAVWDGSGKNFLGFGEYVGDVTVYFIVKPDGSLLSLKDAEVPPSDDVIKESGGFLEKMEENPKIVLDSGKVVYGCQVWWESASTIERKK